MKYTAHFIMDDRHRWNKYTHEWKAVPGKVLEEYSDKVWH